MFFIGGAAGLGAAFAQARPTGFGWSDMLVNALVAVVLVQMTSRSRRWSWVYLAGSATAAAPSLIAGAFGVAALALAFVSVARDRRPRIVGAAIGALTSVVLFRLEVSDPAGGSLLLAGLIAVPVLVSGWRVAPTRLKGPVRRVSYAVAGVCIFATAVAAGAALLASREVSKGVEAAEAGLDAARDGDTQGAASHLHDAEDAFANANQLLAAWWAVPSRSLPGLGSHMDVLLTATESGRGLASSAARTAEEVDLDALSRSSGQIDLAVLKSFDDPLQQALDEVGRASEILGGTDGRVILPPVGARLQELQERLDQVLPEAELAVEAARVAPLLLGAEGPRTYFVAFVQPAEGRSGGGFLGNWAELRAADGVITMSRSGRVTELRDIPGSKDRVLEGPPDYVSRYGRYSPQYWVQDVTMSPDFPSVAEVISNIYPNAGGTEIDGVIQLDPDALAALLELTGPIEIEGYPKKLTSKNAAQILLRDQYLEFSDRSVRADFLDEASREALDVLLDSPLPSPRRASEVLDPVVDTGSLKFWSFHQEEQEFLIRTGIDGSLPAPTTMDFLSVRHQNSANNKIDIFLDRTVRYEVEVDPRTGELQATVRVVLENKAPSEGLPDAVIGDNDKGLAPGTNLMLLSVYTPHRLTGAAIDGEETNPSAESELGYRVYTVEVEIPAGERREVSFDLSGEIRPDSDYQLGVSPQSLVRPDRVTVTISGTGDWVLDSEQLLEAADGSGVSLGGFTLDRNTSIFGKWERGGRQ